MIIGITGTPGVGKTAVGKILKNKGFNVIFVNELLINNSEFITGFDKKRDTKIIDIEKLNDHIQNLVKNKKDNVFFVESHLSHHLSCIDKIIILRCHPDFLKQRLNSKNWSDKKKKENIESEILDIILCETLEIKDVENVFEIDTTDMPIEKVADSVIEIMINDFRFLKKYKIGQIDWSEEIFKQ